MMHRSYTPRGEPPDWPCAGRGPEALHDLPIIGLRQVQLEGEPKRIRNRAAEISRFKNRVRSKIDVERGRAGTLQEHAHIVQVQVEIAGEVLLDKQDANGLPTKLADIEAAPDPPVREWVSRVR